MKVRLADSIEFNHIWLPIAAQVVNLQKMCESDTEVEHLAESIEALKDQIDTLYPLLPAVMITTFDTRFKPQFMDCLSKCGIKSTQAEDFGSCGFGLTLTSVKITAPKARVNELIKAFSTVLETADK